MNDAGSSTSAAAFRLVVLLCALISGAGVLAAGDASAEVLPDDRAYELVSPPATGTVSPSGSALGSNGGWDCFESFLATPSGSRVAFASASGTIEGLPSNGVLSLFESRRTETGWTTESKSATGEQTTHPLGGLCLSPEHSYSTLLTGEAPFEQGSLSVDGKQTSYVREPDGSYMLIGAGSMGVDLRANVKWISDEGAHIIFTSRERLEPNAPAGLGPGHGLNEAEDPVNAIYDRTPSGLAVVSPLPNGAAPNSSTETTFYRGASADGSSVVFAVQKLNNNMTLFEHRAGTKTAAIVTGTSPAEYRFAGISANGERVVYIKKGPSSPPTLVRGSIFVFDAASGLSQPVTIGSEAAVVNVSADGSAVYFTSNEVLTGEENPLGATAQPGQPNLYLWDAASQETHFVATVAPVDVDEDLTAAESLTEWVRTVAQPQQDSTTARMNATSRSTPDGATLVFQARGAVTGTDTGGHSQIYRFSYPDRELACLSCPVSGVPSADSFLQRGSVGPVVALNALARIPNVSEDGHLVFFMSGDRLTEGDVNDAVDVYEWGDGRVALISGGEGTLASLLYGMSADGRDVFFVTTDRLVPQDASSMLSIYDAREGGGFPPPPPASEACEEEACKGGAALAPAEVTPSNLGLVGPGNRAIRRHPCRKRARSHRCHRRQHSPRRHHRKGVR
jgi:hypothetical protein